MEVSLSCEMSGKPNSVEAKNLLMMIEDRNCSVSVWRSRFCSDKFCSVEATNEKSVECTNQCFQRRECVDILIKTYIYKDENQNGNNNNDIRRHLCRVVSALDSQSGGLGFESPSGDLLDFFSVVQSLKPRPLLQIKSQLVESAASWGF